MNDTKKVVNDAALRKLSAALGDRRFSEFKPQRSLKEVLRETFELAGFTWFEMEAFLATSYKLGMNPLPYLRKLAVPCDNRLIDEVVQIVFHKSGDKSPWISRDALICTWDKELGTVSLDVLTHELFQESQPNAQQLDRLTTIISEVKREKGAEREATVAEYQGRAPQPSAADAVLVF